MVDVQELRMHRELRRLGLIAADAPFAVARRFPNDWRLDDPVMLPVLMEL